MEIDEGRSSNVSAIRSGLIIDEPWISKILAGEKRWEMRSENTKKREPIGLIAKGTGKVVGVATLIESLGPLSEEDLASNQHLHRVPLELLGRWRCAWVLSDVRRLRTPVPYVHPPGAVKFVNLDSATVDRVVSEAQESR